MNKRRLHHVLVHLRSVPVWLFLLLSLVFGAVAILSLRANNQRMIELRAAVFEADEQDGDIEGALAELREHVFAHMNTNLSAGNNPVKPPIQLKHHYERLLAAEQEKLRDTNERLLNNAQNYCEQLFPGGVGDDGRVPCIQEYLEMRGGTRSLNEIPKEAYMFDFASPAWSPDLAGWSIVATVTTLFLAAVRFGSEWLIRRELRKHS